MFGLTTMKRYKQLQSECDEIKKQNEYLRTNPDLAVAQTEIERLNQLAAEKSKEMEDVLNEKSSLESVKNSLEAEKTALESEKAALQAAINALDANVDANAIEQFHNELEQREQEIQKNKKKLKELEEEIEDLEEDLDNEKSKHRKEINQVREEKEHLEVSHKQISEELEEKNEKLQESEKTISQKKNSLEFVRDILKAKPVEDAEYTTTYQLIDKTSNYIRDEIIPSVEGMSEDKAFNDNFDKWIEVSKKPWIKNKKSVAVIGEFSAGKTSIVNAILSQGNNSIKLPVSSKATTAIPTYISYRSGMSTYQFYSPDNKLFSLRESSFKQINKDLLDDVDGISKLIKYFVMTNDNPNLRNLSILDTPGFSSQDQEDTDRTVEVINECDALFWVFDVNNGTVNRGSLQIIKEKLTKPLYVIINKVDTKSESAVAEVENEIKNTFLREQVHVEGVLHFGESHDRGDKAKMKTYLDKLMSVFYALNDTSDTDSFLPDILKIVEDRKNQCQKKITKLRKELERLNDAIDAKAESYNTSYNNIYSYCNDVFLTISNGDETWFTEQIKISKNSAGRLMHSMLSLVGGGGMDSELEKLTEYFKSYTDLCQKRDEVESELAQQREILKRRERKCKVLSDDIQSLKGSSKTENISNSNNGKESVTEDSGTFMGIYSESDN